VRLLLVSLLLAAAAAQAHAADGTPRLKFPPSFDCSAVAAGSQRQACNRSQLRPPMGAIPEIRRIPQERGVRSTAPARLPTAKPPTIPRLPGTIDRN
jgi:hypothetical protein